MSYEDECPRNEGAELVLFGIQYSYQISSNWAGYFLDPYSFYSSVISISYLSVQGDLASTDGTVPSPPSCQAPPQNPMGFAVLQHQLSDHRVINLLQHFLP